MNKGNVLVLGNSGSGKSTLINAVLGEDVAYTSYGTKGTTTHVEVYENDEVPFRLIDTIGFEPSILGRLKAIYAVDKWAKDTRKDENHTINLIWFCVDGTAGKLFKTTIDSLIQATSIYKSVPIVVVVTKSYSKMDQSRNIDMIRQAFESHKSAKRRLKAILPVVALEFPIDDTMVVPESGIEELIENTNNIMPEGIKAGSIDISKYILQRKRFFAHSLVVTCVASAATIGAVPIPIADGAVLAPLEAGLVKGIGKIYNVKDNDNSKQLFETIIEIGTVGALAKSIISMIKAIPGIDIAAALLNAFVAGTIVAAIGEGSIYVFEEIYLGHKNVADIDWVRKVFADKKTVKILNKVNTSVAKLVDQDNIKLEDIIKIIVNAIK